MGKKLTRRLEEQENPWGGILMVFFFVLLAMGFWFHNLLIIVASVAILVTKWLWFPKLKSSLRWVDTFIESEEEMIKKGMTPGVVVVTVSTLTIFVILFWACWENNLFLVFVAFVLVTILKLYVTWHTLKKRRKG